MKDIVKYIEIPLTTIPYFLPSLTPIPISKTTRTVFRDSFKYCIFVLYGWGKSQVRLGQPRLGNVRPNDQ